MIMLSQPLTIEDWFGNVYLIKPNIDKEDLSNLDNQSVVKFKKPNLSERRSKMIKRIMVATIINRESISSLLRSLQKQLGVKLDFQNLTVWKLNSKPPSMDCDKSVQNHDSNNKLLENPDQFENRTITELVKISKSSDGDNVFADDLLLKELQNMIPQDVLIDVETSYSDENKSSSEEMDIIPTDHFKSKSVSHNSTLLPDINFSINNIARIATLKEKFVHTKRHFYHKTTSISSIHRNQKFSFYTCWYSNLSMSKNYFILPKDTFTGLSQEICDSERYLLARYLKMIEKVGDSRIKFKSIVQSRRVEHLFYRKVIIYAHDRHGIWLSLQLLKKYVADVVKNAVFYESSLKNNSIISPQCLLALKNEHPILKFATEQCLEDNQLSCNVSKVSRIPVLLAPQLRSIRLSEQNPLLAETVQNTDDNHNRINRLNRRNYGIGTRSLAQSLVQSQ